MPNQLIIPGLQGNQPQESGFTNMTRIYFSDKSSFSTIKQITERFDTLD